MANDEEFEARVRHEVQRRMAATPAMLHSIDADGRLVSVSDAWLAKLGYRREEVLGRRSSEFLTPASREHAVQNVLPEFFRTGRCDNVEYQMLRRDGRVIDVLLSAVLHRDPSGQGQTSLAVITDITVMKETKRRLIESEARYRSLVEDQSELVSLTSPEGVLRYVNHAYAAFQGTKPEAMIGRNLFEFVPKEEHAALVKHLQLVCASAGGIENENQVLMPDGEPRWMEWTNRALRDEQGHVIAIHSVGRDIDERVRAEQRVAESEARYRLLADNSTDIIALLDRDGARRYVSPACLAMTGYTPEEMQVSRTADTTHPDDAARVLAELANMTGECTVTYRMRCKDGRYIWVETTCKPLVGEGQTDLRLCIVRNVDARMRTERQLQESESRYRFLADNSTDLIMLVGHRGKRRYVSPACEKLLGYTPEEMLAINSADALHPDDVALTMRALAHGSGDPTQLEQTRTYRMRRKDGSYVWVEATGRAVDIAGETGQRLLIVRDIEERMKAERQLKESEARYRLLADNSTDMVFQLDTDLVRRYVSPACRELLGYEPEEMVGVKPIDMAHPEDAARLALIFQMLLSGKAERHSIINRVRHRDGRWVWVEAQLRALRGADGSGVTAIIGALRDISIRKAVEDELAEANRRLRALAGQDSLTGLANRRAFDEALAKEHLRSRRDKTELGLIMIDVDHFKRFNDLYGHLAGDDCLRCVGAAIGEAVLRPGDLAARYGGEEFAVLLPDTDEAGAAITAERIREAILGLGIRHAANLNEIVTISAGVASLDCTEIEADRLIETADQALYRAKDSGRNAVMRASAVRLDEGPAAIVA